MRVGFIGLGAMGLPMASNLINASFRLVVYNRTRDRARPLVERGATLADRPADAARGDVVVTMLADDRAVEEVTFGPDGLLDALPVGGVHLSTSTIGVALARRLTDAHERAGTAFVAAPVFGRPEAAASAALFIVAAGKSGAIDRCRPVLDALGQRTFAVGEEPAAAAVVKLTGNFLIASVIESLAEAFALVRKSGIDPAVYLDLLTNTLFTAPVYKVYGGLIAGQRYQPAGFRLPLGLKDVGLVLSAAQAASVPMPVASLVRDHMIAALAQGHAQDDWSVLGRVVARNAGLPD
jgi:3-hydroxyisobutyrate dehydrogenase-like beta-hydroxyacid dehydrogenase